MSDGGSPNDLLKTLSVFGIVIGLLLWVGLFLKLGLFEPGSASTALLVLAWICLPASVATHGVLEPRVSKRRVVAYSLTSAVPLFGVIPASIYLGLIRK
jgi:hypothetical protein